MFSKAKMGFYSNVLKLDELLEWMNKDLAGG
ncbi:hypothetical protein ACVLD2_004222 [Paenibacillus sp. PvR052]|nr:hypothetical protein [Paenibacillus sp. PvP091]MBP1170508.1 hypothetical protein [Paenibacillus sp. PvR098]MBP2441536.1 hypothetical protein [Paenibacillus sp. PvP052]